MIQETADFILHKIGSYRPQTLIILGSGLGGLGEEIQNPIFIDYKDIPDWPQSTVSGHKGRLIAGLLEGKEVLCMQGRFHLYEGHPAETIKTVMSVFKTLGIKNLIVTNAAGSLQQKMAPGSIMLITDHINFSGCNPLVGQNDENFGPRFPVMANAYTKEYQEKMRQIAKAEKIELHEGTYLMVLGPNFETAAEIRAFQVLGADAVGMSTVPEVLSAVWCDMKILGLSVITNYGTGMVKEFHGHEETLQQADNAAGNLTKLVRRFVKEI